MRKICPALLAFLLFYSSCIFAQTDPVQAKAIVVKRMIELNHISPRPVDDSFSVALFRSVLKMADRRRFLFTEPEYKSLAAFATRLDDELQGNGWAFLKLFEAIYKRSLLRADSIINKLLQKPFDFSANETITSSRDETFNFAADITALSARWSKYLKYKALNQLYEMAQADSNGNANLKNVIAQSESKIRERLKLAEIKGLKKMLDHPAGFSDYVSQLYLNAIAMGFDPHTNYFSREEKEKFKEELSTEALSFGLSFDETERGEIVIQKLAPGGPAWKSGDLNEGDELLSLQWEGKQAITVAGLSLEDVYDILDQADDKRLVLEFRKKDGTKRIVLLRKEKMENEENIVKGFVLKGTKKIGYILLPAFYTQWENESGSSCANDVAKEIVKLKKENIDGLILDVRYNGGGSLGEALQLIGIFVDEGPIMGEKQRQDKVMYLKDPNRGTIYNGPMALMVNGQSASASEILAASLQDYNRALIVGSSTFGKATMQQMMVLDTITSKPNQTASTKDIVKVTVGKLYRLSGETAQLNGVTPDIVLPDAFDGLDYREKFLPYALMADKVTKNAYYKPLTSLPAAEVAKKSQERVNASPEFQDIKKITGAIRSRRNKTETIPLKADAFEQWVKLREQELNAIKGHTAAKTNLFTVDNHSLDKTLLSTTAYAREINNGWLTSIADDIYIQETFAVLADLILLQQTKN
ncbi:carboxy terminal-processing peptidase [Terrimonas pollutisoli]|uniref:carboxy terminal-processing peptidase n=1 Tax=Terrimonas pollutisoli TaxID=3034147 RepID=UPI0023ED1F89|nr:carboxy terminal-processing peptidase [Terrimonas sp. H1YJ31]